MNVRWLRRTEWGVCKTWIFDKKNIKCEEQNVKNVQRNSKRKWKSPDKKQTNKTRTNQQPQLWPSPSTSAPASITNVNSSHHHRYSFSYYHHRQQQQQLYCHVICQQVNERQTEGHWVMCWEKEKGRERDYMTMRKMEQWFSLVQVNIIVSRSPVYLLLFLKNIY